MNRSSVFAMFALLGASAAGCTVRDAEGGGTYIASPEEETIPGDAVSQEQEEAVPPQETSVQENTVAYSEPPELVYVEPDVAVVENSSTPVYYADDAYWAYQNGGWFYADYWDAPWVPVEVTAVPVVIENRDHHRFEHFHGRREARRWREPREHIAERRGVRTESPRFERRTQEVSPRAPAVAAPRLERAAPRREPLPTPAAGPRVFRRPMPQVAPRPAPRVAPAPRPRENRIMTPPRTMPAAPTPRAAPLPRAAPAPQPMPAPRRAPAPAAPRPRQRRQNR